MLVFNINSNLAIFLLLLSKHTHGWGLINTNKFYFQQCTEQGEGKNCKSLGETFKPNGPVIHTFQKKRRQYNLQKVSLGIENMF